MASLFDLFSDEAALKVFETVIDQKRIDLRSLREKLRLPEDKASEVLRQLEEEGLLDKVLYPVPDFNVYFASAKGLAASRQLRRANRALS